MPRQTLELSPDSHDTVELAWKGLWKNFTVYAEGRELGQMNGQAELRRGGSWTRQLVGSSFGCSC